MVVLYVLPKEQEICPLKLSALEAALTVVIIYLVFYQFCIDLVRLYLIKFNEKRVALASWELIFRLLLFPIPFVFALSVYVTK